MIETGDWSIWGKVCAAADCAAAKKIAKDLRILIMMAACGVAHHHRRCLGC
jgi:hypothetical protein